MKYALFSLLTVAVLQLRAQQIPEAVFAPNIKSVQLHTYGNQLGYPLIRLNSSDRVELHFDDLDGNIKVYYYTFQLCDADWTPSMLSSFDFIRGFGQQRINTYRISSIAYTRYTHYQAVLPEQNCMPTRSGNYILKVFLNGDTTKTVFTRRMLVLEDKAVITAAIQQPFNSEFFRTHQKVQFKVSLNEQLNVSNQFQQVKTVLMQNWRWDNAITGIQPTFFVRNVMEFNTENDAVFPGGKEWRWINLRSFRLQSDRVDHAIYTTNSTEIFVKPDVSRVGLSYNYYRDNNGWFSIETTESINPYWQSDYGTVNFTYVPPGNQPYTDKDIFLFGKLTDYNLADTFKMSFNESKGAYEKSLFLKMGYYDYSYVTIDQNAKKRTASFSATEGNIWETENNYIVLVYYRSLTGRSDELIGLSVVNSLTSRMR
ncbi:MAG: DUF5103 domain-containing protein [Chitinophagaceae bacterium]